MKVLSLFNNKGGVGKTTLSYHFANALSEMGKKVLMIDLDPQCNLSLCAIDTNEIQKIWEPENDFIDSNGFDSAKKNLTKADYDKLLSEPRTIHFMLKPTEEGTGDIENVIPPYKVSTNLDIVPGRLTLHMYEYRISERWSGAYQGDPLSLRTITKIRDICIKYTNQYGYDYIIIDTSPSLGALNKVIISTVDGFIIPCTPDLFSLYGIRNIGKSLQVWKKELDTIYKLISDDKRKLFPEEFVRFIGYTIYNAKKYTGYTEWNLSKAHFNFAKQIPSAITEFIPFSVRSNLENETAGAPIGGVSIMHSHNTLPTMSQKYHLPIWRVPESVELEEEDKKTIQVNRRMYKDTLPVYKAFADDVISRIGV